MADILKVTTPLVNKNQAVQPKPGAEPVNPFNLQSTTKVIQPHNQSELLKQNNGLFEGKEGATILMNLLKDPSVTVSYLKNIFLLEEIFKLLPANNNTVTPEIEQMFQTLLMDSGDIAAEMVRQENDSTMFKGEIFDFLRILSDSSPPQSEIQRGIANLLKAMNNLMCKDDILDGVANNLKFLAENLSSSKDLYPRLMDLAAQFRGENAAKDFPMLKAEALALLKDVETSILFTPKLSKIISIAIYNLSRFNNNSDYLQEASFYLRQLLTGPQRQQFMSYLEAFQRAVKDGAYHKQYQQPQSAGTQTGHPQSAVAGSQAQQKPDGQVQANQEQAKPTEAGKETPLPHTAPATDKKAEQRPLPENVLGTTPFEFLPRKGGSSKVMETLTELIKRQSNQEGLSLTDEGKVEGILHSLLSSPCNFTPLLHFIVPAFFEDVKAFAEIWINPDSDEKDMPQGTGRGKHFLLVIDVETLGRFEAELFVRDKIIDLSLFCPPGCEELYSGLMKELPKKLAGFSYRLGQLRLEPMEKQRSLMDVFKSLPYKRVGVDVKI